MQSYNIPPVPVISETPKCTDRGESPVPGCGRIRERLKLVMDELCEIGDSDVILEDRDRMADLTDAMRATSSLIARIAKSDRG